MCSVLPAVNQFLALVYILKLSLSMPFYHHIHHRPIEFLPFPRLKVKIPFHKPSLKLGFSVPFISGPSTQLDPIRPQPLYLPDDGKFRNDVWQCVGLGAEVVVIKFMRTWYMIMRISSPQASLYLAHYFSSPMYLSHFSRYNYFIKLIFSSFFIDFIYKF